jgi:hypothetical protein
MGDWGRQSRDSYLRKTGKEKTGRKIIRLLTGTRKKKARKRKR